MRTLTLCASMLLCATFAHVAKAQLTAPSFGKGIRIKAQDSSFTMKVGFRFQTLYNNEWTANDFDLGTLDNHESAILIRRSRLKFDGWAFTPKLKYKAELSLSNRDNGGGNDDRYGNAANTILDAWAEYTFYKGFSIRAGQGKMAGNRERLVSSGNLQFVDRSRLNSRYTLDRDVGVMINHKHTLGKNFILKETFSAVSGEGKNLISDNVGGHAYTFKAEAYPFGAFKSKGDYVGSAVKYEEKPKLAFAVAYDINQNAGRERGQKGSWLVDSLGNPVGKDLNSLFVDFMFKYKRWSMMGEYASRYTSDNDPNVYTSDNNTVLGTYYAGSAVNLAIGYMTKSKWELAGRYTTVSPQKQVANAEQQYTLGLSKFIVGHKLKVQTDMTYRAVDNSNDNFIYRIQMDIHF